MVQERGKQLRGGESEFSSSDGNSSTDGDAEPGEVIPLWVPPLPSNLWTWRKVI